MSRVSAPLLVLVLLASSAAVMSGCARGCRSSSEPQATGETATPVSLPAERPAASAPAPAPVAGPGGIRRLPACSLVSRLEVQEILGSPIGRPMPTESTGTTECVYPPSQIGHRNQANVTIAWNSPRTGPSLTHQLADVGRGTEPGPRVAQHVALGDEADWSLDGELTVRTGPTLITVSVGMGPESRQQGEAIARKILDRLGGAPLPDPGADEEKKEDDPPAGMDELLGAPKVH